ncbi:hypothetical protein [Inquilinus limosus]|uniref:Uncharacterized protein n=1 Tax=Inquilinus limosus TaxID=171674 RepID=A0A211ZEY6_9PROT|nr:hypothetical protein [Inquilinus limosus]OWJ63697.1 hypothetical protein BWR60_28595 [Inquilinus limosus]
MVVISPSVLPAPALIEPKAAVVPVALPLDQKAANVFDYALPLQPAHKSVADYAPSLKAKLLANPAAMGDQLLNSLQRFHKDTMALGARLDEKQPAPATQTTASLTTPGAAKPGLQPGPAAAPQQAAPEVDFKGQMREMRAATQEFNNGMLRTTLVTTTARQLGNVPETLLRG